MNCKGGTGGKGLQICQTAMTPGRPEWWPRCDWDLRPGENVGFGCFQVFCVHPSALPFLCVIESKGWTFGKVSYLERTLLNPGR